MNDEQNQLISDTVRSLLDNFTPDDPRFNDIVFLWERIVELNCKLHNEQVFRQFYENKTYELMGLK